jgi:hypothetical protein
MAFTGNFMCTSFKQELLVGTHNFTTSTGDVFKLALYTIQLRLLQPQQRTLRLTKLGTLVHILLVVESLTNVTPTTSEYNSAYRF